MKQNGIRPEHLPMLLIQQIRLQWYKDCRGGNAAAQRNRYPRAMRLPEDFFSYYPFGLPTHFISVIQKPDGFYIEKDCRRLMEWKADNTMRFRPFEVIRGFGGVRVCYDYGLHNGAIPERHKYDPAISRYVPLQEPAFDLVEGGYGRAVCNGRFRDWDTGSWYYVLDILNVMLLPEPVASLDCFVDREPEQVYEQIALLR